MILSQSKKELLDVIKRNIDKPEDICSVIIYGSRADGRAHSFSDYDLVIFHREPDSVRKVFFKDDLRYSCYVLSLEMSNSKNLIPFLTNLHFKGKVIYDPYSIGKQYIDAVNTRVVNAAQTSLHRKRAIEGRLELLKKEAERDNSKKQFAKCNLLALSFDYSFLYHGMPDVGGKRQFDVLIRDNYKIADAYAKALLPDATWSDIDYWLDIGLSESFNADSTNLEFTKPSCVYDSVYTDKNGNKYTFYDLYTRIKRVASKTRVTFENDKLQIKALY